MLFMCSSLFTTINSYLLYPTLLYFITIIIISTVIYF